MSLIVTLTGGAGKYLIRGAIWEFGASSYRAYVHLVPPGPRLDFQSGVSVVSVSGPTSQQVLDAAIGQVMTTAKARVVVGARSAVFAPVQNLQVRAAPRDSEAGYMPSKG
jgi:hypothetical protein